MSLQFSKSILNTKKSFIREILKLTQTPEIISFAGGLPNKDLFPVQEIKDSAAKVIESDGKDILQYSTTEGYLPLRQYIADRYKQKGLDVSADEILIISGSQQGLDLMGKIFLDVGDTVVLEKPGYLGAIQAFSLFSPEFKQVTLTENGIDCNELEDSIKETNPKIYYTTPNFQNPTGLTYSEQVRKDAAAIAVKNNVIVLEDDPYGELRFMGDHITPVKKFAGNSGVLLGSFSKIAAPGLRIGWIVANKEIMDKLVTAKQGTDLHTSSFVQRILFQYIEDYGIDNHLQKIKDKYKKQRMVMVESMKQYMPDCISFTEPEGGMFLWCTLPENKSAMDLFNIAIKKGVAFVPGEPFYTDNRISNSFRLNYSCSDEKTIEAGVIRLKDAINEYFKG